MTGSPELMVAFLNGPSKKFIVPVYQRNYNWKRDNCSLLYDDLVTVIKMNKPNHFFGSIVSSSPSYSEIILIDGQQRVTTISILILAMINAIKNHAVEVQNQQLVRELMNTYIVNEYNQDERKIKLKPFRNDCDAFDKLIYGEEKDYLASSNVTINYRYFYYRITEDKELTVEELYEAIKKLLVIHIDLQPQYGDNPQLIFESLNSTGLELTESDKIRNFVLMGLSADKQEQFYDKYWFKIEKAAGNELDAFIRDYLTVKTGSITVIRKVYFAFKEYAKSRSNIEDILGDMLEYATIFKAIKDHDFGNKKANAIISRFELLEMSVAYPFLFAFINTYHMESMPEEELVAVLSTIESYVFRRQMCELPTNALNKIFAALHRRVIKLRKAAPGSAYSAILIHILESYKMSAAFPKDSDFITGFTTRNIYGLRSKNRSYLLERLENGDSKEVNDVLKNIENGTYTVEHIMPQTLSPAWEASLGDEAKRIHEEWLHTVANLTLTGYNSEYSNLPFTQKKTIENGFADSGLRLNQYLLQFDAWTEEELKARRKHLSEKALRIWPYPATSFQPQKPENESIALNEDFVFKGRYLKAYVFMGEEHPADSWAGALLELAKLLYQLDPAPLFAEALDKNDVWISSIEHDSSYKMVADGIYLCTASDTNTKLRVFRNLLSRYNVDEDELSFILWPLRVP